ELSHRARDVAGPRRSGELGARGVLRGRADAARRAARDDGLLWRARTASASPSRPCGVGHRVASVLRPSHGCGRREARFQGERLSAPGETERDLPPPGVRDVRGGAARARAAAAAGPDNFMWASDYPHPDSTFPHSREAIARAFAGLDAAFVEQVTATNCARLYGFA